MVASVNGSSPCLRSQHKLGCERIWHEREVFDPSATLLDLDRFQGSGRRVAESFNLHNSRIAAEYLNFTLVITSGS